MSRRGLLLINAGSPDSPHEADVRRYLRQSLMDERVLDLPQPARWLLVNFRIVPGCVAESTKAYRSIWSAKGSPLIVAGRSLAAKLETALDMPVALAMRYGRPTVSLALRRLFNAGARELTVLPLFPHDTSPGYESAARHVDDEIRTMIPGMDHHFIEPYFDAPEYLEALTASARPFLARGFDHLLFSFPGVHERHLRKADPTGRHCLASEHCCELVSPARATCYRAQCLSAARELAHRLEITEGQWSAAFQSHRTSGPWIKPHTDQMLKVLAERGVKRLLVMCPGLAADSVETLDRIAISGRKTFRSTGGGELTLIPCLNDQPAWVEALASIVARNLDGARAIPAHSY